MQPIPTIRKQPANTVRYGSDISTRGGFVWCAYSDGKLVAVAPTVKEVKRKYRQAWSENLTSRRWQ